MVAEVCLGQVGAVAAREVSRFPRNSREWQKLVEVCRVVDTLLIDQEMVYTPRQSNDRLLLGLKGSLNEYELDLLRQRSVEARREKARRGELIVASPAGYADRRAVGGEVKTQVSGTFSLTKVVHFGNDKKTSDDSRAATRWIARVAAGQPKRKCWKPTRCGAIQRFHITRCAASAL
jgi:DNA invertase Pin-like site-specific DNA recombinase